MKLKYIMERIINIILIVVVLITGCAGKRKNIEEKRSIQYKKIKLEGKLTVYTEKHNKVYYLETNWKSRSKISYKITNPELIKEKINKIVKVEANLLKKMSPWAGKIKILKILSFKEEQEKNKTGR